MYVYVFFDFILQSGSSAILDIAEVDLRRRGPRLRRQASPRPHLGDALRAGEARERGFLQRAQPRDAEGWPAGAARGAGCVRAVRFQRGVARRMGFVVQESR